MGLPSLQGTYSQKMQWLEDRVSELQQGARLNQAQAVEQALGELKSTLQELQVFHQGLEQQNRELQDGQAALAEEQQHYRELFDQAPDGYLVTDLLGNIRQANRTFAARLGPLHKDIVGRPLSAFIVAEDRRSFRDCLNLAARRQRPGDLETSIQSRSGDAFPARIAVRPVHDFQGQVTALRWLVHEITEQKRSEEALRFQGQIISNLSEGVVVVRDSDGTIAYANSRFEEMFGYGPADLLGKHISTLSAPAEKRPEEAFQEILSALREHGSWSGEVQNITRDGTPFWCHASISAFKHHEQGNLWIAVHTDINRRKAAEEALKEREARFRSLVEAASAAIIITDPEGRILSWNPGARSTFGYAQEEVLGQNITLLVPDRLHAEYRHRLERAADSWRSRVVGGTPEFQARRQDGREFPAELSLFSWRNGSQRFFGAIIRDITQRKEAEEALRFQGQIMRNLAEGVVVIRDSDGTIVYTNSRFEEMFGYGPAELIGMPMSSLNAPGAKRQEETFQEISAALRERGSWSGEVRNIRKDGSTFWSHVSVTAFDHHGYGKLWISVRTDITLRKAAEEALRESETKFRSLVESANAAIVITDQEGRIVSWNPGARDIFGYTEAEALAQPATLLIPERYQEVRQEALERAAETGAGNPPGKPLELPARRKDGSEFPAELSLFSWTTEGRRFFGAIIRDITERRQAGEYQMKLREMGLKEEEWSRLQTLIDTSPVGVLVVDAATRRLVLVNQEAQRLRGEAYQPGLSVDEFGQGITLRRPDGREWEVADRPLRRALLYGETVRAEEILVEFPDGHQFPTLVSASPVYSKDGQIVSAICVIQDLSPRQELEQLRNEFLGMVTHELRAPLSTIKGAAATGLRGRGVPRSNDDQELFHIIESQVDHVTDLVHDLLDMSRIEAGAFSVSMEPTDLESMLNEAISSFARVNPVIRVEVQSPPQLPEVRVDRWRIVQVLSNLLNNAARFSPPNCPITVGLEHQGNYVTVHVRDQGPGIPQEKLPYLFKKFNRLEESHASRDSGTGLGLAICQGIVEAHGEHIWADSSTDGTGTTISFTLPVVLEPAQPLPLPSGAGDTAPDGPGTPGERLKILVVDDDQNALKFLRRLLEGVGYQVMLASDPEEALETVALKTPHLALLDMVLPNFHGLDLMRQIREFHEVPVIFLTARDARDDMVNALKMGADDYITKPFSDSELLARIEAVLRRNSLTRKIEKTPPYQFDGLAIDFDQRRVNVEGHEVSLSATEYRLLSELAKHSGRVMTHEQILQQVWGRDYSGETELLRSTVRRLRQKLGDNAQSPRYVITVSQVGYRMAVPSPLQPVS